VDLATGVLACSSMASDALPRRDVDSARCYIVVVDEPEHGSHYQKMGTGLFAFALSGLMLGIVCSLSAEK